MRIEEHRVTDAEQRNAPFPEYADVGAILFNGPVQFGRGVKPIGPDDGWQAWRDVDGTTVVRIFRAVAST